ncbi:MAG: hypothetical protein U1C74_17535 [Phenylobacterium sp.]|nr:hypothetical protein [Phenylobacterium sp.]
MSTLTIGRQFCGPPNSGNGGYVCGILSGELEGPVTTILRAPIPLDTELTVSRQDAGAVLMGKEGALIAQGGPARQALPEPPLVPTLAMARSAGERHLGHAQRIHPICFTCGPQREEGDGLRVFPGQVQDAEPGVVACTWTPHRDFARADGTVGPEIVWAALDCPGYFAWVVREGRHGALLGTMTGELEAPVRAGTEYIVLAWPLAKEGRKEISGVALFDAEGRRLARGHQVWITMSPGAFGPGPPPAKAADGG